MNITLMVAVLVAMVSFAVVLLKPVPASAHCDTADGPAVRDGRRALATGNINYALKWIGPDGESELRDAYDRALAARRPDAESTAEEDAFLEALVRIHRAGEGAEFDGIKPSGTDIGPVVAAADAALESGSLDQLTELIDADRIPRLRTLFGEALARKDFDVDDVAAGRDYIAAYVTYFKYAEGEDHHGQHAHSA
jgi:hypothetical protein